MLGERLKLARKKMGFSLRTLADAIGGEVSAQAIGKYERGEMTPSSGVLVRLSKALDVSLEFLMSEQVKELEGVEFRKNSGTTVRDRSQVEAAVIDRLERYLSVEEILELDSANWHAPAFGRKILEKVEDAEVLADELRDAWDLGLDPILNMTELLEEHGIKVLMFDLPKKVFGLTCMVQRSDDEPLVPVIVVNKNSTLERRRLTLGHELGHRVIDGVSPVDHEKAATVFAGSFLVPKEHLIREIGKQRNAIGYNELIQLKRMYRVSAAAFLMRLRQIGVIDQSALAYAFQTYARGWRKEEPVELEDKEERGEHEVPRRFERLCYWALAERFVSPGKAAELLELPLAVIEQEMKGPSVVNADHRQ